MRIKSNGWTISYVAVAVIIVAAAIFASCADNPGSRLNYRQAYDRVTGGIRSIGCQPTKCWAQSNPPYIRCEMDCSDKTIR